MTAPEAQVSRQHPPLRPNCCRLQRLRVDRSELEVEDSELARVAIDVEFVLVQLAETDCLHENATSAAAWQLASVAPPTGTADLGKRIDSTDAVGIDSHNPYEDIVETAADNLGDDLKMLGYLGM